ncbi:MAG TPA: C39 family peptidase [Caldilineaceae bacterium]|nr:C39 family peptidase [Caldilineaceae bacterium]
MRTRIHPTNLAVSLVAATALVIIASGCVRLVALPLGSTVQPTPFVVEPSRSAPTPPIAARPVPSPALASSPAPVARVNLPTPTAEPTATPLPLYQPAQSTARVEGLAHYWQTWNNCGPATLAMNLSYYGSTLDQAAIGTVLRTHQDDKNVLPEELVAFAQSQGFQAQVRVNGNDQQLRILLSNGIPVLLETWLEETPNDGMGHYRLLVGYDDAAQSWIAYDSYVRGPQVNPNGDYAGIYLPYEQTAAWWKVFNHTYVLVYTEAQRPLVAAILGDELDPARMWQRALTSAQAAVAQQPDDAFLWFNLGTDLVQQSDYAGAAAAYDQARTLGLPWRMLWYQFGPFQAYYAVGRLDDVMQLADSVLANTRSIEEIHYWRGMVLAAQGQAEAARQAWQQAIALNPHFAPAQQALAESSG